MSSSSLQAAPPVNGTAVKSAAPSADGRAPRDGELSPGAVDRRLTQVQDLFIRRWGEMGQTWGINRTQAEIFSFLFITGRPQCTDDVMERLNISRGNASMSLRALCDWGIIRRFHRRGERREYFETIGDVWEIFSIIAEERKRREMDPVLETIEDCRRQLGEGEIGPDAARDAAVKITRQRLGDMSEFMGITNQIFQQFVGDSRSGMQRIAELFLKAMK